MFVVLEGRLLFDSGYGLCCRAFRQDTAQKEVYIFVAEIVITL